jgi:hypothetical protein
MAPHASKFNVDLDIVDTFVEPTKIYENYTICGKIIGGAKVQRATLLRAPS